MADPHRENRAAAAGPDPTTGTRPVVQEFSATWTPGSTDLTGTCFCGARHRDRDPVAMWDWLDGHPEGHHPGGPTGRTVT
ncbi:hypothetical protein ABGB07_32390 [Micromonosporaceae bacterium B7E4]